MVSVRSPIKPLTTAAANKMMIITSANWDNNIAAMLRLEPSTNSFFPFACKFFSAASLVRPSSLLPNLLNASCMLA